MVVAGDYLRVLTKICMVYCVLELVYVWVCWLQRVVEAVS
jgi:hypothetical protein